VAVLGAAYQIGRSALTAYQAAVTVAGQNIANVSNPDYTRQSARLAALSGGLLPGGISAGTGVTVETLLRHIDDALEGRLRSALSQRAAAQTQYQALNQVETLYSELTDYDLSTQLSEFFASFANLQTDPLEPTARDLVIAKADAIATTLRRHRAGLLAQISDLNGQVEAAVREINTLAGQIADLNGQIVATAANGRGGDSALRDRRDGLLRRLAELLDVQTRVQQNGVINVYVGSEPLVEYGRARSLTTRTSIDNGIERVEVRFADNQGPVRVQTGQLAALVVARDTYLAGQLDRLDQLARGLIYEINRVHASGCGLSGYTRIEGTYAVNNPAAALNTAGAGLTYPVQEGTFVVHVRNTETGETTTRMIAVDLDGLPDPDLPGGQDTSLNVLVRMLGEVPGLSATVTPDNRIRIDAAPSYEVSFSDDTSGVLAALGIATFFDGTDAATLSVHAAIRANPALIAASSGGAAGDGTNAGHLAAVATQASTLLGGRTIPDFHAATVTQLGVDTAAAQTTYDASDAVYSGLLAHREATSGVNLDEEAVNLTMFERSFQGAARYLSVLDTLSESVLALVR